MPRKPPPLPNLRGTRVLVVDDEASARDAIQGLLAQWGCEVIAVEGGDDAVAQARIRRPDLVLCDLSLADGDSGVHVVDRLRREHGAGLACAFITGESAPERISEARATRISDRVQAHEAGQAACADRAPAPLRFPPFVSGIQWWRRARRTRV